MNLPKRVTIIMILGGVALLAAGACGSSKSSLPPPPAPSPNVTGSLAQTLDELSALPTPAGVDDALFARLKQALAEALIARRARAASMLPTGPANSVDSLDSTNTSADEVVLEWQGKNIGDYSMDGIVNISDITPLAAHFNEEVASAAHPDTAAWIDGNGDGVINISDITPLAANFGNSLSGYVVLHAETAGVNPPTDEDYTPFGDTETNPVVALPPVHPGQPPQYRYTASGLDTAKIHYFRVAPVNDVDSGWGEVSSVEIVPPGSLFNLFVTILWPRDGQTVGDEVPVLVAWPMARDDIDHVTYDVDGTLFDTENDEPYITEWDTGALSEGEHTLHAVITTESDETAEDSVTVTVQHGHEPAAPDPTAPGPYQAGKTTIDIPPNPGVPFALPMLGSILYFPSDDGESISADKPFPAVLIARAEGVAVDEYDYLARRLASHGYVVLIPNFAQQALLPIPGAKIPLDKRGADLNWAAMFFFATSMMPDQGFYEWALPMIAAVGHGTGFAAAVAGDTDPEETGTFRGIIALAPRDSFFGAPYALDAVPTLLPDTPLVMLAAENDGISEAGHNFDAFYQTSAGITVGISILGGNFSAFTDSLDIDGDGSLEIDREEQHDVVVTYTTAAMGIILKGMENAYMDYVVGDYAQNDIRTEWQAKNID
ncbi:MAG: hypothetical protein B1H03_01115 [Planctomycetales bacterium 4484_113]|nr:MAG: hypothetical protein B1H03_01115 [Planctomycetales bacterium 4484_113]